MLNHDQPPVDVVDLRKTYPGPVEAVRGITFSVRRGEIFGLLGPNGAGKTTTVGILTTVVRPSDGRVAVAGHDVQRDPLKVREAIGVVFQDSVLDADFTARENLRLHARLWRVDDGQARVERLLAAVGLAERADESVRAFSGGMRRRLEIARGLLARPTVLFLDEPTLGLDPIARRDLWQVVRALRDEYGVSILLTTHYLEEAQGICDRVAIINGGRIIAEGRPLELVRRHGGEVAELTVESDPGQVRDALERLHIGTATATAETVTLISTLERSELAAHVNELALEHLGVKTLTTRATTLNDVFLQLTDAGTDRDLVGAIR
ncbi:MAG TPA: ATP-binding cassette domain-containing protein [Solirubrobacteraceae bacterium]|nr:ATP-binding cassette domain-containing protein [Solirubrobacteraceae bacterium]